MPSNARDDSPPTTPDHKQLTHDLRMRVLAGEDIQAEEMLLIVEDIRRGRRTAATLAGRPKKGAKLGGRAAPLPPADLNSILDAEI